MIILQLVCDKWDLGSQAISWFSAGHFSHVDTVLNDGALLGARSDRIKGIAPGVQIRPPGYARFTSRRLFCLPCTNDQRGDYFQFLQNQLGKPYDVRAIWGFAFNRNWRMKDSWICSELVCAGLEHAGIIPELYLAANKITPVTLVAILTAKGATWSADYCAP